VRYVSVSASTELLLHSLYRQPGNLCTHKTVLHSFGTVACAHAQVLVCAVVFPQCLVSPGVAMQVFGSLPDQQGAQPLSAAGVNTGSGVQPLPVRQRTAASVQVQVNCSSSQVLCCRSACQSSTLFQATCLVDISWLPCHLLSSRHLEPSMPKRGINHDSGTHGHKRYASLQEDTKRGQGSAPPSPAQLESPWSAGQPLPDLGDLEGHKAAPQLARPSQACLCLSWQTAIAIDC